MIRTKALQHQSKEILTEKAKTVLRSFLHGKSGDFQDMLHYLERYLADGIKAGHFTQEESQEDLETALWYSYACNHIDAYEYYYMVTQWMPFSRHRAQGCATWFYRYSVALMYCGRLDEALTAAEQGVLEDSSYPWIWLQVAKMRYHGGGDEAALEAVHRGMALEPDSYEFKKLEKEIRRGTSLVEMCSHPIRPVMNSEGGLSKDEKQKIHALTGILCDRKSLAQIKNIFRPDRWIANAPYCWFYYPVQDIRVKVVFCMNEASISHLSFQWIKERKQLLDSHIDAFIEGPNQEKGILEQVEFRQGYQMILQYREVVQ